ncbi:transglycosylase domain-containing protein [Gracilibacillus sp. HCP3S3_G5_1]|uniref:transglycosylase domain-containing protein n=1 Tax=unclassified Gracilibacillus TaxID=2625209 RepID=UPI003F8C45A2
MKKRFSSFTEQFRSVFDKCNLKKLSRNMRITYLVVNKLVLILCVFIILSFLFAGGTAAGYFASLVKDEPLSSEEELRNAIYSYEETSAIYFADNIYLGTVPTELERYEIDLEDVSEHVIHALISTEDEYFYEHEGIVPKAILRAGVQEVTNASVQTGGSTLTQQLIKQQILTNEVSFERKATEILLALRLEKFMDKEEILEAYLNVTPFGRNANGRQISGVQAAAQGIFGVDASELNIPQAAFIAGLAQSPFGYTPFTSEGTVKEDINPGLNRMKTVLTNMIKNGYITEQEYQEALTYDIKENLTSPTPTSLDKYQYLTNDILKRASDILRDQLLAEDDIVLSEIEDKEERDQVREEYQLKATAALRQNGYKIHTTIDKELYDALQETVSDNSLFGSERTVSKDGETKIDKEEVAAVLLDNSTGAILAYIGGRDEGKTDNQFNLATQAVRPNGSTMKPLIAYSPALELGIIQPDTIMPDTEEFYRDNNQLIKNFDGSYKGKLTIRQSLAQSRNIPAIRAFKEVPADYSKEVFDKLGFHYFENALPESAPLGQIDVTVEQNVNAFATFANGGDYVKSYLIESIETNDGEEIYRHEKETVNVFSPQTSYLIIDMLRDVLRGGGTAAGIPSQLKFQADWAGKTGTSQEAKDYWFVATNPNVTLGVWLGYPENLVLDNDYSPRLQRIWARIANTAYDVDAELMNPSQRFQEPEGIVHRGSDIFNSKFVGLQGTTRFIEMYPTEDDEEKEKEEERKEEEKREERNKQEEEKRKEEERNKQEDKKKEEERKKQEEEKRKEEERKKQEEEKKKEEERKKQEEEKRKEEERKKQEEEKKKEEENKQQEEQKGEEEG